ncbi:MAG: hypothetical protein H6631_08905 [Anaerolineaceae bacterium]|nr:hypothetical protein [Anaerolineaceae bacterium]MCB9100509.1 hypothetical protein [Anaerolineales bacterium]
MIQIFQRNLNVSLVIFLLATALFMGPRQIEAQEAIKLIDQTWESSFNQAVTFSAEASSSAEIVDADLFYRVVGQLATSRNQGEFTPGTTVNATYTIDLTDPVNYQPPGTELEFWWKFVDADGNELKTEPETLSYLDDRHTWETLSNDRLTLSWYNGDARFGETLFERANEALDTLETDFGASIEDPIKIFIYGSQPELLDAMSAGAQEWTGGAAYTDYGVVVIGISSGQLDWGLKAMTHEMSHLVIHQATDNPFGGGDTLPRWLDEGIAVYNENRTELDEDFKPLFDRAVANNNLMTLRTLSSPFPSDTMQANLAYGESGAVVKFMIDTYGSESMADLLGVFAEGALYDEALEQAIGLNMDQLDNAFRASLGLPPLPGTEANSEARDAAGQTEPAVAAKPTDEASSNEPAVAAAVESEAAQDAAPASKPAAAASAPEPAKNSGPLSALPCAAGLLMALALGGTLFGWRLSSGS